MLTAICFGLAVICAIIIVTIIAGYILLYTVIAIWALIQFIIDLFLDVKENITLSQDSFKETYENQQKMKKELEEKENKDRRNAYLQEAYQKNVNAVMSKQKKLETQYPLADKELLNQFGIGYLTRNLEQTKALVEKIKQQHESRTFLQSNDGVTYTIDNILSLEVAAQHNTLPLATKVYHNQNDYIAFVYNMVTNEYNWYVTHDFILARMIIDNIDNIAKNGNADDCKMSTQRFNQIVNNIKLLRENNN